MENNLKQWFDAAKEAKPVVSVQEVGTMINTSPAKGRVKPTLKTYIIMGTSLIVIGALTWMLSLNPEHTPIAETQQTVQPSIELKQAKPEVDYAKQHEHINAGSIRYGNAKAKSPDEISESFSDNKDLSDATGKAMPVQDQFVHPLSAVHPAIDTTGRILYADQSTLKKLGITIEAGRINYYYKTYEHAGKVRATQLVGKGDRFYFVKGIPGKNYFIKPWEDDFYPLYLTNAVGGDQQNFHFQDIPAGVDEKDYKEKLSNTFQATQKKLVPIGIYAPGNRDLSILWYKPTKAFLQQLPKEYEEYYSKEAPSSIAVRGLTTIDVEAPEDTVLHLSNKELAMLGIETDGHKLRYLTQTDTARLQHDIGTPLTVFAFNFDISTVGDIRISNTAKDDSVLHNRSVKVMPLIVSVDKSAENEKEPEYWLQRNDVPIEYRFTYIESVKNSLVPVMVKTNPITGLSKKSKTMLLWYANTEEFRNLLPVELAYHVKHYYTTFDENAHQALIHSLVERRKENDVKYTLSKVRRDELWDARLILTSRELKKLGINFNGSKLEFRIVNTGTQNKQAVTTVQITPDMYQINTRGKMLNSGLTDVFPWYTTDTNMVVPLQNFHDQYGSGTKTYELHIRDRKKAFISRLDSMVPVYVEFDEVAFKNAKYKDPIRGQILWFPITPSFIEALPARYKTQLALRTAKIDIKKVTVIELPDSLYAPLGITAATGKITIPSGSIDDKEPFMGTYSHGGSSVEIATLSRKEYYALPEEERGDSVKIFLGTDPLNILYMFYRKSDNAYPSPVLITNGNGTHWYANNYKGRDYELNDSDIVYIRANHIRLEDYPKFRKRDEAARMERMSTLGSLIPIHVYAHRVSAKEEPFDLIAWYEPTLELFKVLPVNIGGQIRKEYEAISKDEKAPSCIYFEECRNVKGKITSVMAYPNPVSEELTIRVQVEEERNITISIADISGRVIKVVTEEQPQFKGVHDYTAGMGELKEGIYMVLIETDKGERVVQRIIRK